MYTVKISFKPVKTNEIESLNDSVNGLLGAWRMNGQILGKQFLIAEVKNGLEVYVNTPAADSLDEKFNNKYVTGDISRVKSLKVEPKVTVLGKEPESAMQCECPKIAKYILFTTYVSWESPLRCFECFGTIPLYRIPKTADDEYHDIISWVSNYQSCDSLQMNCRVGERFGLEQMSKLDSALTKDGLQVCRSIEKVTGGKVFYYLHKYRAKSRESELLRKCPNCGGNWYVKKPLHDIFDFVCRKCRLLSNIAWDVRR
jgi:predicted  nucleic acid-binding Zn ribbon protein